uniref:nonsense-mediated mRNA decay protein 2-like n=1 Tax=Podarcis muralis TaxID=64176 RepID=UPI00109FE659|nr:nonsense-mediated mRNA decay protein 2-like [Podarcis muralis]
MPSPTSGDKPASHEKPGSSVKPAPESKPKPEDKPEKVDDKDDNDDEDDIFEDEGNEGGNSDASDADNGGDGDAFDKELDYGLDRPADNAYAYHDMWSDEDAENPDIGLEAEEASWPHEFGWDFNNGKPAFDAWGDKPMKDIGKQKQTTPRRA